MRRWRCRGRLELLDELATAGHVSHNPFPQQSQGVEGLKQRASMVRAAFNPHFTIEHLIADGDVVDVSDFLVSVGVMPGRPVADLVARVVCDPSTRGETLSIGGPPNLTMLEFAAATQRPASRAASPRHVPRAGLRIMAALTRPFKPVLARQARTALLMDSADMTFDPHVTGGAYPDLPCTTLANLLAARTAAGRSAPPAGVAVS